MVRILHARPGAKRGKRARLKAVRKKRRDKVRALAASLGRCQRKVIALERSMHSHMSRVHGG